MSATFRFEPVPADRTRVHEIVRSSGFFNDDEAAIAVELVDAALEHGEASGYLFIFAEIEGRVAGYSCFGPIPATRASWDLYWIAVEPARRGEGLGRAILLATESRIVDRSGARLYADTSSRPQYAPTHRFYERAGYRAEAHLEDYYAPGDGRLTYSKVLL